MASLFLWWFVVWVLGLTAFPVSFIVLKHLPDKGYFFSKVLALLWVGYFSWILGYVSFNTGTIVLAFLLLAALSGFLLLNWVREPFFEFLKKNLGLFIVVEGLFFIVLLVAGAYKMMSHDIIGTEKPMDFAMINGILASPSMPPQDPWLAGGSISYYYFGYLIVAVLCKITGVTPGEAYNLGLALTWALAAVSAFSLAYALTKKFRYSLFSMACLAFLGNMDFWHRVVQSFQYGDLRAPYYSSPVSPGSAVGMSGALAFLFSPLQHYWDYFQASRIIPVSGNDKMINEFPSFSFFLSDSHPHVMAIPFVLLAMAYAFNFLKTPSPGFGAFSGQAAWKGFQWFFWALLFGALSFLNSWDFPTLMLLMGLCFFLQQWWTGEKGNNNWLKPVAILGIPFVLGSFLLYLPFYWRFQSQAQGLGFVGDRTNLYYLVVLFGLFFTVIIPPLIGRTFRKVSSGKERPVSNKRDGLLCVICGKDSEGRKFCGHCGGEAAFSPDLEVQTFPRDFVRTFFSSLGTWFVNEKISRRGWAILRELILRDSVKTFFSSLRTWLVNEKISRYGWSILKVLILILLLKLASTSFATLAVAVFLAVFCLMSLSLKMESKEMVFATLLVFVASLLLGGCEVLFIRDFFGGSALYRMNSVFKFHYQAWIFLSLAAGPFLKWLVEEQWPRWAPWKKALWLAPAGFAFLGAFLYPVLALKSRMKDTASEPVSLEGTLSYERSPWADFQAALQAASWIKEHIKPVGGKVPVILEAWGGSYAPAVEKAGGRLATLTGYPTLLGWDFHEVQWRGSGDKTVIRGGNPDDTIVRRQADVDALYTSSDLNQTRDLLGKYGVDYVYVGDVERKKYQGHTEAFAKFAQVGSPVWAQGSYVLYKVNP